MDNKQVVKLSKFMSLVLRHKPEVIGLKLDEHGWVSVEELIDKMNRDGKKIDRTALNFIVQNNSKKRFAFNDTFDKIRASQGHSININLGYIAQNPPEMLYHGTATRFLDSIMQTGLEKRNRHHVHLTADKTTATQVGQRHGKVIILEVLAQQMFKDGYQFFVSENGVWLTENVPVNYIQK